MAQPSIQDAGAWDGHNGATRASTPAFSITVGGAGVFGMAWGWVGIVGTSSMTSSWTGAPTTGQIFGHGGFQGGEGQLDYALEPSAGAAGMEAVTGSGNKVIQCGVWSFKDVNTISAGDAFGTSVTGVGTATNPSVTVPTTPAQVAFGILQSNSDATGQDITTPGSFFWNSESNAQYALGPGSVVVDWKTLAVNNWELLGLAIKGVETPVGQIWYSKMRDWLKELEWRKKWLRVKKQINNGGLRGFPNRQDTLVFLKGAGEMGYEKAQFTKGGPSDKDLEDFWEGLLLGNKRTFLGGLNG